MSRKKTFIINTQLLILFSARFQLPAGFRDGGVRQSGRQTADHAQLLAGGDARGFRDRQDGSRRRGQDHDPLQGHVENRREGPLL